MGFGYNFTNKFALHLDWSWASMNYNAKIGTADAGGNPAGTTTASGTLDSSTLALNLSYYFLEGPLTPFVLGGIGWTWVDSNVPSGLPETGWLVGPVVRLHLHVLPGNLRQGLLLVQPGTRRALGRFARLLPARKRRHAVDGYRESGNHGLPGGRLDIGFLF